MLQAGTYEPGGWADLAWIAALGFAGASALHPSMVEMTDPVTGPRRAASASRMIVLGARCWRLQWASCSGPEAPMRT